jgi:adenylate/guanylate cyclase catalytic domain protein
VDKYLPDGLMVLFDERAEDVIKCLLQISLLVQRENIERVLNGEDELLFSSGIHYGPLMIGTIGKEERMDGTVISDAVNIASRLNSYALKQNIPIVISQIVKDNFEDDINDCEAKFQYKGRVQLKGKIEAMEIYEVIRG